MQVVAYVPASDYALRDAVKAAVGLRKDGEPFKVVFRDPMAFESPDADVLDTVVYVPEGHRDMARQEVASPGHQAWKIRQAYEAFPNTRVLSLDETPLLAIPSEVIPYELRPVPGQAGMPEPGEMPAGRIGRRNIASTEPKPPETPA